MTVSGAVAYIGHRPSVRKLEGKNPVRHPKRYTCPCRFAAEVIGLSALSFRARNRTDEGSITVVYSSQARVLPMTHLITEHLLTLPPSTIHDRRPSSICTLQKGEACQLCRGKA